MINQPISFTMKHLLIIVLLLFGYWFSIDKVNHKDFKKDLESVIKTNITNETYSYIKSKPHMLTGLLCVTSGMIMNGLPVRTNYLRRISF
jgi:hypothetical protein